MFNSINHTYLKRKIFPLKLSFNSFNKKINIFNLTKFNFTAVNPNNHAHKKDEHNHNHSNQVNTHNNHNHHHDHNHNHHNDHHDDEHHDDHHHHHHEEVKEYHDFKFDRVSYNQKLTEETREK